MAQQERIDSKPVASYEVIDHGIEHSQYFQGCGVAFTEYADCFTGCGNDASEALDDAIESACQCGYKFSDDDYNGAMDDLSDRKTSVSALSSRASDHESYDDHYYYVSILLK